MCRKVRFMGHLLCYPMGVKNKHPTDGKGEYARFEMKWVRDQIEVFREGVFCFSADNRAEAERELRELAA